MWVRIPPGVQNMSKILKVKDFLIRNELNELANNIFHGIARAKKDLENINISIGDEGIITAYLPDIKKFAIMFSKPQWITFDWTEEQFLDYFEIIQIDKCQ